MERKVQLGYTPMTETAFFILLCLQREGHGYGIGQRVQELTNGRILIGPGTMYGTLSKMEKDGLIAICRMEDKRKLYRITPLGRSILEAEKARIRELYRILEEEGS